jgi:hypothetical protein
MELSVPLALVLSRSSWGALLVALVTWCWPLASRLLGRIVSGEGRKQEGRCILIRGFVSQCRGATWCNIPSTAKGLLRFASTHLDAMDRSARVESLDIETAFSTDQRTTLLVPVEHGFRRTSDEGREDDGLCGGVLWDCLSRSLSLKMDQYDAGCDLGNGMSLVVRLRHGPCGIKGGSSGFKSSGFNSSGDDRSENTSVTVRLSSRTKTYEEMRAFIDHCVNEHEALMNLGVNADRLHVFEYAGLDDQGEAAFTRAPFESTKTFGNMFFKDKDALVKRVRFFDSAEGREHSERLGIQHALSFLFHGMPGCGKTSAIKALASLTGRHIVIMRMERLLRDCADKKSTRSWVDVLRSCMRSPRLGEVTLAQASRLYVFEEVDCWLVAHQRKQSAEYDTSNEKKTDATSMLIDSILQHTSSSTQAATHDSGAAFGALLEIMDGIVEMPGRMMVMTTNYIERLDSALLRPGRIDMVVEFGKLSARHVADTFALWFPGAPLLTVHDWTLGRLDGKMTQAELCRELHSHGTDYASAAAALLERALN